MNTELIRRNKEAFDHWLYGGKILSLVELPGVKKWGYDPNIWNNINIDTKIVINDSYLELRKAHKNGKTILFNNGSTIEDKDWVVSSNPTFLKPQNFYKIKE